ncbi:type II toxin-antitoxin system Phd/YefM family antitoxin [Endothiovibrio diazotrophicus]
MSHPTAVNVTELRQHLPEYLARVGRGEEFEITSRGKTIARIVPQENPRAEAKALLAELRQGAVVGDVESGVGEEWTADEDHL